MKINEHTALIGKDLILLPYRASHVVRYHEFMSDPNVRELTASEELSLEEEYEMQASWRNDDDKLTFIILKRGNSNSNNSLDAADVARIDNPDNMIGDVNLFLSDYYNSEDEEEEEEEVEDSVTSSSKLSQPPPRKRAELELMIASTSARRSGYGIQSIQIFLSYCSTTLNLLPSDFFAKIGMANEGSIKLFEKLGFVKGKVSEVFQEVEMVWSGGREWSWEKSYEAIGYLE